MSKHDDRVSIKDMLSHASEAVELLGEASREELGHDRVIQLALTRLVEIIGKAEDIKLEQRAALLSWLNGHFGYELTRGTAPNRATPSRPRPRKALEI